MDLSIAMKVAVSGLKAQTHRMNVISENLANANSLASKPGEEPYRRREAQVYADFDDNLGAEIARLGRNIVDRSPLRVEYRPSHPGADNEGYLSLPNVDTLVEIVDMRQAQRAYEANLNVVQTARQMVSQAIGILRG